MRIFLLLVAALPAFAASLKLTPEMQTVVNHITAASLRGHLSFIASDLLEGRSTPSRGLDIAAEYIAAQFRRAGLEPVGDDGYFQSAHYLSVESELLKINLKLENGSDTVVIPKEQATLQL